MEAIQDDFDASVLRTFSLDVWDGSQAQCDLFQELSGTSFPVLMNAGYLREDDQYGTGHRAIFVIDGNGTVVYSYRGPVDPPAITAAIEAAVADLGSEIAVGDLPGAAALLGANYPNPFNPATSIPYEVPAGRGSSQVRLDVVDLQGRVVRTLVADSRPTGRYVAVFDGLDRRGTQLPSGSYLARLKVGGAETSRVMTLVK